MLKQILKNITVLNVILIMSVAVFANYGLKPRLNTSIALKPQAVLDGNEESESDEDDKDSETTLNPQEYRIIADMNLFHPERKLVKYVPPKVEEKLPMPEFILYGTLVTENTKLAFIDDKKSPYSSPGGGKRHRTLKIGDTLSGFTLTEIDHEKAVMVRNLEEIVLRKSASQDKKPSQPQTGRAGQAPSRVTSQPQPAATAPQPAATVLTVPAVSVTPAAKTTTPTPTTAPAKPAPTQQQHQRQQQPQQQQQQQQQQTR